MDVASELSILQRYDMEEAWGELIGFKTDDGEWVKWDDIQAIIDKLNKEG